MHSLGGAKELFRQLPGSCLPPQAQHFLRQLFLSRGFPPARKDLLFGIWTLFCWCHLSHWRWGSKYVLASLPRGFPSVGAVLQLGPCWTGTCSYKVWGPVPQWYLMQPPGEGLEAERMGTGRVEQGVCPFHRHQRERRGNLSLLAKACVMAKGRPWALSCEIVWSITN